MARRKRCSRLNYQALEPRQMLATLFMGGNGNDTAKLTYVDDTHVDVVINKTLHENVDISDGLRINLAGNETVFNADVGRPGMDRLEIDHRIVGDVSIHNTEVIRVDGGDNEFQIGFIPDPLEPGEVYFGASSNNLDLVPRQVLNLGLGPIVAAASSRRLLGQDAPATFLQTQRLSFDRALVRHDVSIVRAQTP